MTLSPAVLRRGRVEWCVLACLRGRESRRQQYPVVALQHDRVTVHEYVEQQRQASCHPPAAYRGVDHDPEHRDEQDEVACLRILHPLLEFCQTLGGPFRGQVQPGVEHRKRATAQQPLHEPHSKALVEPGVTLEDAELVVSPWQPRLDDTAHRSEPCHRRPHNKERERDARRSQHAHAEQHHRHDNSSRGRDEEALAHDAIIAVPSYPKVGAKDLSPTEPLAHPDVDRW
jgi:hypothetical protein